MVIDTTKIKFSEFLKLPAAKQLITVLLIAVTSLSSVITWEELVKIPQRDRKISDLQKDKTTLEHDFGVSQLMLAQKCDSEKNASKDAFSRYLQDRLDAKEKILDEALEESKVVINTQNRTRTKVRKITKQVKKLVQNEK